MCYWSKVQKNYVGSKALVDQAVNQDVVKRVLKMTSLSVGTAQLATEELAYMQKKGYKVPETHLSDLLATKQSGMKRTYREAQSSSSSESVSGDESPVEPSRKRRGHRRS